MKKYLRTFDTKEAAENTMKIKNRACKKAGNDRDIYCMVSGPTNNFAIVDLDTAIEMEALYSIAY